MTREERLLQPVFGYIELGMYDEAKRELALLPDDLQQKAEAKLAQLELLVETKEWGRGASLACELCRSWPEKSFFWIKWAYCLHELRRTSEARDVILSAPPETQAEPLVRYNLACYESQLGHIDHAKELLSMAIKADRGYQAIALDDPDLQPIWDSLNNTASPKD